jgi:hypothetical protein
MNKNADAGTSPVSECSGTGLRYRMPECRCRRHRPRCRCPAKLKYSLRPLYNETKCHLVREDYTGLPAIAGKQFFVSISDNFAPGCNNIYSKFSSLSCLVFYVHCHTYINRHMHSQIFYVCTQVILHSCTQKENRIHADIRLLKTVRGVWGKIRKTCVKQQNKHVERQFSVPSFLFSQIAIENVA